MLKFESYTFKNILPHKKYGETIMSRHSSLKSSGKIKVKRNVLKRYERIDILKKTGKLKDGDSPFGLPKTKPEA